MPTEFFYPLRRRLMQTPVADLWLVLQQLDRIFEVLRAVFQGSLGDPGLIIAVSKEFEIPICQSTNLANAPAVHVAAAFQACIQGPHKPINPHRQRLLAASHKQAKLEKASATNKKAKAKAKKKATQPAAGHTTGTDPDAAVHATVNEEPEPKAKKPTAKPKKPASTTKPAADGNAKAKQQPWPDTPYNVERKAFLKRFLATCWFTLFFFAYILICPFAEATNNAEQTRGWDPSCQPEPRSRGAIVHTAYKLSSFPFRLAMCPHFVVSGGKRLRSGSRFFLVCPQASRSVGGISEEGACVLS